MSLSPPLSYLLHFISVSMDSPVINDMTEALHSLGIEVYLFLTEKEVVLAKSVKDYAQVCFVLFDRARKYEDIVHVYMDEATNAVAKYRRHQALKHQRCITVTHLHYLAPEGAKYGSKCSFRYMSWIHADLFICL
jgi:hypothetical protein